MTSAVAAIAVRLHKRPADVMEWSEHEVALCLAAFRIAEKPING